MAIKSTLPERYPDIIDMYVKGHGHSRDILKADFVEFPPNGLDIVNPPDFDVDFKSIFGTSTGLKRLIPNLSTIFWTTYLMKSNPLLASAHLLLMSTAKVAELGGFVDPNRSESAIFINDFYRLFGVTQSGRRFLSHIMMHEFKHLVQLRDHKESLSSSFDSDRLGIKAMLEDDPSKTIQYLAEECEVQARLHTVMVGAYHQFGEMPTNFWELMAVLESQGIEIEKEFEVDLKTSRPGIKARKKFERDDDLFARYADKSAIKDLNRVLNSIQGKHQKAFTERVIPFVYGDMLELYGDRLGHKRFGHSHNIQLREVFYKSAVGAEMAADKLQSIKFRDVVLRAAANDDAEYDPDSLEIETEKSDLKQKVHTHFTQAIKAIDHMSADDAASLGRMLYHSTPYQEYGGSARIQFRQDGVGPEAIKRIYERDDLSAHDRQSLRQAYLKVRNSGSKFIGKETQKPDPNPLHENPTRSGGGPKYQLVA